MTEQERQAILKEKSRQVAKKKYRWNWFVYYASNTSAFIVLISVLLRHKALGLEYTQSQAVWGWILLGGVLLLHHPIHNLIDSIGKTPPE